MNAATIRCFLISVVAVFMAGALSAHAEDKPQNIVTVMHKNFDAMMALQYFAADPVRFSDPKNRDEIQKNIDALVDVKHVFKGKSSEQEAGIAAISTLFSDYLRDIQKSFKAGASGSYLRNQVRTMGGFCMNCHTRVSSTRNFSDMQDRIEKSQMTPFQKAEYYAATRQFDKAITVFDQIISSTPSGELGYIEFSRAVRTALSVTVRVKQDAKATFYLLEKLASRTDLPEFFKRYVGIWKHDVAEWNSEKAKAKGLNADQLLAKADGLIKKAQKEQLFAVDPAGDISFLRATNLLHEALQNNPKMAKRGEALYMLGSCYDALQDPLLWALDSLYFEACIRENPHSSIAKKCYQRYATKLYFGYSGSGGTFVPEDEIKKLSDLRKLSE